MDELRRVYLVENDDVFRSALLRLFSNGLPGFTLVGAAFDAANVAADLDDLPVDLLLTDLKLPGQAGLELIVQVKEAHPHIGCLLMTGHGSPELPRRALLVGADAVLIKPFGAEELLQTLRAVDAGQRVLSPAALAHLLASLPPPAAPEAELDADCLAPQEVRLLELLVSDHKLLKEAADTMGISLETARTYRKRIYSKLGVHKLGEARDKYFGGGEAGHVQHPHPA